MDTQVKIHRIFVRHDPTVLRIHPPLAQEVGLNESIVLLQLDFLISIARGKDGEPIILDDRAWTYQSLRDLKRNWFPFWSPQTIGRALNNLETRELLCVTDRYNTHHYDKTQWFALNPQGFRSLRSVTLDMVQLNGTGLFHIGTGLFQDGTTIPENTSDLNIDVRGNQDYLELQNEVVRVCKRLNILALKETDLVVIDKLHAMGLRRGDLLSHYAGQDSWWFSVNWKGKRAQFPTPSDILETIGQAQAYKAGDVPIVAPAKPARKARGQTGDYLKDNPPGEGSEWKL